MKNVGLFLILALMLAAAPALVWAGDCVDVDVELPPVVVAESGAYATGYFELINCGDEAAVIELSVAIEITGIPPFEIASIPVPMGAGEVLSREFWMPIPPNAGGNEVTICVTAVSGTAEASDCATMVIEEGAFSAAGSSKTFGFQMAAAGDCVDVDLELPDTVVAGPGSVAEGYFELTNCGDEAAAIELEVALELPDTSFTISGITVPLGAGETVSREFRFPVPSFVPTGTYAICVTATAGEATATTCQTVEVIGGPALADGAVKLTNYPNPFNPRTTIAFELPAATEVTVTVYNTLGQEVKVLHEGTLPAGEHRFDWEGTDSRGRTVSSGIYLYRVRAGNEFASRKMMLIK